MAGISQEDIQKVRDASDLVAIVGERVPLRQRGREFWGCCPFHNEKTPSFKVDPSTQLWHCFGCGEGGDVFGFIMKSDDVSFPDAVRMLAQRARIDIQESSGTVMANSRKARLKEACSETASFYHSQLMRGKSQDAAAARTYLSGRGLGGNVPKKWCLGFAPGRMALVKHLTSKGFTSQDMIDANVATTGKDGKLRDRFYNRVMFPIFDPQGDCIAFGGRVIGQGEPKYLNSQETPLFHKSRVLYGLDKAKNALTNTGVALIVEGYTDVIALHEAGIENAVATLGTALTIQHIRLISRYASKRIVYLFDGDAAGQRAADRALEFIDEDMTPEAGKARIELCAVTLPDNQDPAEFVASHDPAELKELIDGAKPLVAYGIDRRLASCDLSTVEGRTAALTKALSVLAPIKDSILAKDYAVQIASKLRLREKDVLDALAALKAPRRYSNENSLSEQEPTAIDEPIVQTFEISQSEKNRRKFERELISFLAKNPALALEHADALGQTDWHDTMNRVVAESMLDVLAEDPGASAAVLVSTIAQRNPQAAGILTGGATGTRQETTQLVTYLIEELQIGDMEQTIEMLKSQLQSLDSANEEERTIVFHSIAELQKSLNAKRAAHKMPY